MKNKIISILKLTMLFLSIQSIAFAQPPCDPGDPNGDPGCPSGDCGGQGGNRFRIPIIFPKDPNEIIGPKGIGENKWVSVDAIMPYKILFENDPDFATAPAQKVRVFFPIPAYLNPNSLRLGDFGFGNFIFSVPVNTTSYYKRLDVKDSLGVYVDITAGLDQSKNQAFWVFESIDTATGLSSTLPANFGFLPVNDSLKGNGEGFVTFTMQPSSSSVSGDSILATADILFDTEDTIATNTTFNTIDADKPESHIDTLSATSNNLISLNWSGNDAESGLLHYNIYYAANGGPYQPLLTDTTITSFQFLGQNSTSYSFYSIAVDSTGNREDPPFTPDAITQVGNDQLVLNLKVFIQGFYLAFETMTPNLMNQGVGNDPNTTDTITVELRQANFPYAIVSSQKSLLSINGLSTILFDSVTYGSYYIVVKHRYAIQTWSTTPIVFQSPQKSYDFSNDISQAYGNNLTEVETGIWAIYTGDINQDENIDILDLGLLDNSILNFNFGYYSQDLNGDGNVDLLDNPLLDENSSNFIFSQHP